MDMWIKSTCSFQLIRFIDLCNLWEKATYFLKNLLLHKLGNI